MGRVTLNEAYTELTSRVYEDDLSSQRYYLSLIEEQRNISVEYLINRGCLFIPNNDYIHHYIGAQADSYWLEMYRDNQCIWTLYVTIPIQDLAGDVVGLVGWDVQNKFKQISEGDQGLPMYRTASKHVFAKEKYFLTDVELLRDTFEQRTIFVVDGVFDSIALNYRGIPAIALLGSMFSREVLYFLRWFSRVFVVTDNDDAGVKLYQRLRGALPNVYRVTQNKGKDIEELVRKEAVDGPITAQLHEILSNGQRGDVRLIC